jgi:hypothetical protein
MSRRRKPGRIARALGKFLLFDLVIDKGSRPIMIYVTGTILFGALIYHLLEGWNWIDSLYFVVITTTTIGYGDITPTTPLTKFITIFFALNGVAILVMLLDQIRRVRIREYDDASSDDNSSNPTTT